MSYCSSENVLCNGSTDSSWVQRVLGVLTENLVTSELSGEESHVYQLSFRLTYFPHNPKHRDVV